MNIERFHIEFDITLDKLDSSAYAELLDEEKDYYLQEAISRIVKQRYYKNNIYKKGFEEIQKRTDDLKNLVVSKYCELTPMESYTDNVFKADLNTLFEDIDLEDPTTDQYMFYIKSIVGITYKGCTKFRRPKLVQQDDLATIINDPFNKPTASRPVIFFEDGGIMITAGDEAVIESFFVTFIKHPDLVNIGTYDEPKVECNLSEHMHKEIVQLAASIAIENIESKRIQTQPINVQQSE